MTGIKKSNFLISIIIPTHNSQGTIEACLLAVGHSTYHHYEVIIVDDNSCDNTIDIIKRFDVKVFRQIQNQGPAAARNKGASHAKGDILLFLDSDIIIKNNFLKKLIIAFNRGKIDGLMGVFSDKVRYHNFSSEYKNMWMRYTYHRLDGPVALFFTSTAAIKRDLFEKSGGFDIQYKRPSIEDTEIGLRLNRMGCQIHIRKELEVEHLKQYSFFSLLKTDFVRAADMVKMALRERFSMLKEGNITATPSVFMLSIPIAYLILIIMLFWIYSMQYIYLSVLMLLFFVFLVINQDFLKILFRQKGFLFFLKAAGFLFIDCIASGMGASYGCLDYLLGRKY